jgi:hypothetical protein
MSELDIANGYLPSAVVALREITDSRSVLATGMLRPGIQIPEKIA